MNDDEHHHSSFGCHIAKSDNVAPGSVVNLMQAVEEKYDFLLMDLSHSPLQISKLFKIDDDDDGQDDDDPDANCGTEN